MNEERSKYMREYMRRKRAAELVQTEEGEKKRGGLAVEDANELGQQREIAEMTATDAAFETMKPGYWIFEQELQKTQEGENRKCWMCGKEFETRLALNKFCGPKCKDEWLRTAVRAK